MYDDIAKTKILIQRQRNWCGWSACLYCRINQLTITKNGDEIWVVSKVFPSKKKHKLPLQFGSGDGRF